MLATTLSTFEDVKTAVRRVAPRAGTAPPAIDHATGEGVAVTLRGVSKSFDENEVLTNLDLHIPAGQFVAVVGRSGCGKSTLLRLILGLEQPTSGRIALESRALRAPTKRIMFQEPRLLPWARVADNVIPVGHVRHENRRVLVGCGDASLELVRVQIPGGKPIEGNAMLQAPLLADGTVLGTTNAPEQRPPLVVPVEPD